MGKAPRKGVKPTLMRRQIIEEDAVRVARNEAESEWDRALDAWEAATFVMAHDPQVGTAVTESGKVRSFVFQGSLTNGMPSITVLYEDQDPFLIIHDVKYWRPTKYEQQIH